MFETEYVSMKTNTACLPLTEILTGSKQVSAKLERKKDPKRGPTLEGAFCSLFSHINETQTAVDTSLPSVLRNASALAPCGQEERVFFLVFLGLSAGSHQPPFLLSRQQRLSGPP